MKNEDTRASDNDNDTDGDNDDATVPQEIVGVLPAGATFGGGMSGTTTAGNQGAYLGGAALLPIITPGKGGDAEDQRIAQEFEGALAEDPTLAPNATSDLQFSVLDRVVHLAGKTPSDHDRQTIVAIARRMNGVVGVEDKLVNG